MEQDLKVDDVIAQLVDRTDITVAGIARRREPVLPFAEPVLAQFIHELKLVAALAIWNFVREYPAYLRSLKSDMHSLLCNVLFEIVFGEIMDILNPTFSWPT